VCGFGFAVNVGVDVTLVLSEWASEEFRVWYRSIILGKLNRIVVAIVGVEVFVMTEKRKGLSWGLDFGLYCEKGVTLFHCQVLQMLLLQYTALH